MSLLKALYLKKYFLFGILIGMIPFSYFLLTGFNTDWEKVSDPMAHAIHFYLLIPGSFLFLIVFAVSGWFYSINNYANYLRPSVIISIFISVFISFCLFFSGAISFIEIAKYSFALIVIISPALLFVALLIGR